MGTERSDAAYGYWREASDKFDYFVVGGTGALAAYIGQTIQPVRLGVNQQSIEWLALAFLGISILFGFGRLESAVTLYKLQHASLYSEEGRAALTEASKNELAINALTGQMVNSRQAMEEALRCGVMAHASRELSGKTIKKALWRYRLRNGFLLLGILALAIARILPAYFAH